MGIMHLYCNMGSRIYGVNCPVNSDIGYFGLSIELNRGRVIEFASH